MAHRIEIALKDRLADARGERVQRRIERDLDLEVRRVRTIDVYTVDADLSQGQLKAIASGSYLDPVSQTYAIDAPLASAFDWLVEVGFKPGVTDNVGKTAAEAAELRLGRAFKRGEAVYTSVQYAISGRLSREQVEKIAMGLLGNSLIHRFEIVLTCPKDPYPTVYGNDLPFRNGLFNLFHLTKEQLIYFLKNP